jgi:hypothetical protein
VSVTLATSSETPHCSQLLLKVLQQSALAVDTAAVCSWPFAKQALYLFCRAQTWSAGRQTAQRVSHTCALQGIAGKAVALYGCPVPHPTPPLHPTTIPPGNTHPLPLSLLPLCSPTAHVQPPTATDNSWLDHMEPAKPTHAYALGFIGHTCWNTDIPCWNTNIPCSTTMMLHIATPTRPLVRNLHNRPSHLANTQHHCYCLLLLADVSVLLHARQLPWPAVLPLHTRCNLHVCCMPSTQNDRHWPLPTPLVAYSAGSSPCCCMGLLRQLLLLFQYCCCGLLHGGLLHCCSPQDPLHGVLTAPRGIHRYCLPAVLAARVPAQLYPKPNAAVPQTQGMGMATPTATDPHTPGRVVKLAHTRTLHLPPPCCAGRCTTLLVHVQGNLTYVHVC